MGPLGPCRPGGIEFLQSRSAFLAVGLWDLSPGTLFFPIRWGLSSRGETVSFATHSRVSAAQPPTVSSGGSLRVRLGSIQSPLFGCDAYNYRLRQPSVVL